MAANTATITDISWADMAAAGIDIDLIERVPTQLGVDEYVGTRGNVRVAFGPTVDVEGDGGEESDLGWNITLYDRENDYWVSSGSEWMQESRDVLTLVARVLA